MPYSFRCLLALVFFNFLLASDALANNDSPLILPTSKLNVEQKNPIHQLKSEIQAFKQSSVQFKQEQSLLQKEIDGLPSQIQFNQAPLNQQLSMANVTIGQLSQSILESQSQLQLVSTQLEQLQTSLANKPSIEFVQTEQQKLTLAKMAAQKIALSEQVNLIKLQLTLLEKQLEIHTNYTYRLNRQLTANRNNTIRSVSGESYELDQPLNKEFKAKNIELVARLSELNHQIERLAQQQRQASQSLFAQEKLHEQIDQQIKYVSLSFAFGDAFVRLLNSLAPAPSLSDLNILVDETQIALYRTELQYEQDKANQLNANSSLAELLGSNLALQKSLIDGYQQLLDEAALLKLSYKKLDDNYTNLKERLHSNLLWIKNAIPINKVWFEDIHFSINFFVQEPLIEKLVSSIKHFEQTWAWWPISLVLVLMLADVSRQSYRQYIKRLSSHVGNVTQDAFSSTLKVLMSSLLMACLYPLPIFLAGLLWWQSSELQVQACGLAIMFLAGMLLIRNYLSHSANKHGLLPIHLALPLPLVHRLKAIIDQHIYLSAVPISLFLMTNHLGITQLHNGLGRLAFIVTSLLIFRALNHLSALEFSQTNRQNKNRKLFISLIWFALKLVPILSILLAASGYFFTAIQLMTQLMLSLLLAIGFILIFAVVKRWILIEERNIAFDRAKARRAEILAQRHHTEDSEASESEEPLLDLDTISSQSLGLAKTVVIVAFLFSLFTLWSQTHAALFSFLDSVTLWDVTNTVNGVDSTTSISLRALLLAILIVSFSLIINGNLPGLLELTVLQKLDLSPGTGFAITAVSRYLMVTVACLVAFSVLGLQWSKLQWLVAALTVGLGFGLQEIFANFISGLIILFEKPFRIGDTVTIRELTGEVSKIQIRATTIVDWDMKEIIVPNKAFITEQLVNWSLSDPVTRVIVKVSVARDSDPSLVEALLFQSVKECEYALEFPEPEVWFAGFGEHTQDYEIRAFADDMDNRWPLRHKLHKNITKKLRENHVTLAYPQLEIHVNNSASNTTLDNGGIFRG